MPKIKTIYICRNCGVESPKWIGRCPSCNQWNTYVEEKIAQSKSTLSVVSNSAISQPISIEQIKADKIERFPSGINELDRLLGGGIVPGSLILIGGEPGIGKSTLALQIALGSEKKVLYVSGEESPEQLKIRAERIAGKNPNCKVYCEVNLEQLFNQFEKEKPDLMIVDSIQTLHTETIESSPGSISQIRECAAQLLKLSKFTHVPIFLIGHITKDGMLAGPKVLEHIVDTVLQFEGDHQHVYRILRSVKNRFGSTSELAIFEMESDGLHEIISPSEIFLSKNNYPLSGVSIASTIDGMRPFLIEVQALVSSAVYGIPQRTSTGFDNKRLNMLLAVLERKAGFNLASKDVFLNIAGGLKVQDTATDLAVACAILSSNFDKAIEMNLCMAAEISLTGELKQVSRLEQRISEASRLGFKKIIIPVYSKRRSENNGSKIEVLQCSKIEDALRIIY
ncbi:DNA repair protein RadA [subsurface metagenome]